jgi:hypothetical protein
LHNTKQTGKKKKRKKRRHFIQAGYKGRISSINLEEECGKRGTQTCCLIDWTHANNIAGKSARMHIYVFLFEVV